MTKKTRFIILLFCVICFFSAAPILVAYSMGYRFNFDEMRVVATGGIYVRTFPSAEQVVIDSKISTKLGIFANSIFVQSLLPKDHAVAIKKDGYFDYSKILPVKENEVTKLENVLLFKKDIKFSSLVNGVDYFSVAPNSQNIITASAAGKIITFSYSTLNNTDPLQTFSISQAGKVSGIKWADNSTVALIEIQSSDNVFYYLFNSALEKPAAIRLSYLDKNSQQISFNPQDPLTVFYIKNKTLYSAKGNSSLPIINNIVAFRASGSTITWLSSSGILSNSGYFGDQIAKISAENFAIDSSKKYEILSIVSNTYLKENDRLFLLNQNTKTFEESTVPATDYEISASPDNKNLIYWSKNKISLYSFSDNKFNEIFSGSQIAGLYWLNNDYIIFSDGEKVIISETDYRGNVNAITLPETTATQIFFNRQDNKLYFLSNNSLLSSEKLIP